MHNIAGDIKTLVSLPFLFYLLTGTFLLYPILGLYLNNYFSKYINSTLFKIGIAFVIVHNTLFYLGYSIKGDDFDNFMFSVDYFCLCIYVICILKFDNQNIIIKTVKALGIIIISLGYVLGFIGVLFLFNFIALNSKIYKKYSFKYKNENYELRMYDNSGRDDLYLRYNLETYQTYPYIPIEKRVKDTIIVNNNDSFNLEENLKPEIIVLDNKKELILKNDNGHSIMLILK